MQCLQPNRCNQAQASLLARGLSLARGSFMSRGLSLVEVLVALAVLCSATLAIAGLPLLAMRTNEVARLTTFAAVAASQKMEQLLSAEWIEPDASSVFASSRNSPGYCEVLDDQGHELGTCKSRPQGGAFVRRWGFDRTQSAAVFVIQVAVTPVAADAAPAGQRRRGGRCGLSVSNGNLETAAGFSLVELAIVTLVGTAVLGAAFTMLQSGQRRFDVELERADVQQRVRSGVESITHHLALTGGGLRYGAAHRLLGLPMTAIFPYRQGTSKPDAPGSFRSDTITVLFAPARSAAQTTLQQAHSATSGTAVINFDPGCPRPDPACGFSQGMDVLLFDETGSFDLFRVASVQPGLLQVDHSMPDTAHTYLPGSHIIEATMATFAVRGDSNSGSFQLTREEGLAVAPVVDHLVGLEFAYFGDPHPPALLRPTTDPVGPWTTYGPRPPPPGTRTTAYGPGENCAFTLDASTSAQIPRLTEIGFGEPALVKLSPAQLTDGPWCPDALDPHRYDADLLRIRRISVMLRVEASLAALRGPAGRLFSRGGSAMSGALWVTDQEVHFDIAPKNLNLGR
jgi:prepilin-type N-terminal cleavage/methylation domain-containing protein